MKISKTVTDPVHGNIGLTQIEAEIMQSSVMQRLHNVRQLGLAHLVYPGANYSRFAHSVGACHNAANMLDAIGRNHEALKTERIQKYRLVALLHDIGHYPFSHAAETVIKNYYAENIFSVSTTLQPQLQQSNAEVGAGPQQIAPLSSYDHEQVGNFIIQNDTEIVEILGRYDIDPSEVAALFSKTIPDKLIGLISSDLDCDRLDYLKRTAHNSGAPYGSVDIRFLIDQATRDADGIFCFNGKAARAADHLLVSRFYDYMQVPFNKTVVALEWSLSICLRELLERGNLDCSSKAIEKKVRDGAWKYFDDPFVFGSFREIIREISKGSVLYDHAIAILDRKPAKLLASWDAITSGKKDQASKQTKFISKRLIEEVGRDFSLEKDRLFVWETPVEFSKIDADSDLNHPSEAELAEAVQVLDKQTGKADLLAKRKDTLIQHLFAYRMAGLRLYYMPENGKMSDELKEKIIARFSEVFGKPVF